MNAEIITIGDEILIGQIVDTNSQWIAQQLNKIGVSVYQITSIQDEKQHILKTLAEAQTRANVIIITGGLGPTKDDITKKTLAEFFDNDSMVEYPEVITHIKTMFAKFNIPFKPIQNQQALIPSKATLLKNRFGTAPGMWFYENDTVFISLPGVPYEMKALIKNEVLPRIQQQFKLPFILHKTLMTYGEGESNIAERIEDFENGLPSHIKLAYLPSFGRVRLRLSAKGPEKETLEQELHLKVEELKALVADIYVGLDDNNSLEKSIGQILTKQGKTISTAESLTGGKIASSLVSIPGSSKYFLGSIVAYQEEVKVEFLNVSKDSIQENTTVSAEVAEQMAKGALEKFTTDYSIAVTGNAGPTTDNNDKTVGLVYIAIATKEAVKSFEFNFGQPREKVINKTVNKSLELLLKELR